MRIPQLMTRWKIGQRVFFSITEVGVEVTARPGRIFEGRILSSRIARSKRPIKIAANNR